MQQQQVNSCHFPGYSSIATTYYSSADCIMESSSMNVGEQEIEFAPIVKIDPKSHLWKYVTVVRNIQRGGPFIWIYSECQKEFKASYTRVKAHLFGIKNINI